MYCVLPAVAHCWTILLYFMAVVTGPGSFVCLCSIAVLCSLPITHQSQVSTDFDNLPLADQVALAGQGDLVAAYWLLARTSNTDITYVCKHLCGSSAQAQLVCMVDTFTYVSPSLMICHGIDARTGVHTRNTDA